MAKNNKILKRVSPCSAYDISGTEQWLEEMAAKGYHLRPDNGFMLGIARFEVGEPIRVKYRLEAASARMALFEVLHWNTDIKPNEEALQIYEEMGWEYVTNRLAFHVYRSTREDAREFNTDPAMQAEGLKSAGVRLLLLFLGIVWGGIDQLIRAFFYSFSFGVGNHGALLTILMLVFDIWVALEVINRCVRFLVYWRKVKSGTNVRTRRAKRSTFFIRMILLAVLWLSCLVVSIANAAQSSEIPIENYTDPVPFAEMTAGFPGSVLVEEELGEFWYTNTVETWSSLAASENLDWNESANLVLPDETEIKPSRQVTYHLARNEWFAEMLVDEKIREIKQLPHEYREIDAPDVDIDYILVYGSEVGGPTLIMREGLHVISSSIGYPGIAADPSMLDLDNWVTAMAEALLAYAAED